MSEAPDDRREPVQPWRRAVRRGASSRTGGGPRGGGRYHGRDRYQHFRGQLPIEELIGLLIKNNGLTDAVRQQCVFIFWRDIVGERIADKTRPDSITDGVLKASAKTSVWVHELQFFKAQMIEQINTWTESHRAWLGPPPLVTDIRFSLGAQQRDPAVDPDHVRRLRLRQLRRLRPRDLEPPVVSDADRAAILAVTTTVEDDELRATIERVRLLWNR